MLKIIYIKNYKDHKKDDIEFVSNNIAHGLYERGVAKTCLEIDENVAIHRIEEERKRVRAERRRLRKIAKAQKDKMMRPESNNKKNTGQRYKTK